MSRITVGLRSSVPFWLSRYRQDLRQRLGGEMASADTHLTGGLGMDLPAGRTLPVLVTV